MDGLAPADLFAGFNVLLFIGMCVAVYYDRFIVYRGRENIIEFFLYAIVVMSAIGIAWLLLRAFRFSGILLLLMEVGILMHFAGGLVHMDGARLYDHFFVGIRYDKYVHFTNSLIGALMLRDFFRRTDMHVPRFEAFIVVLIVLGFGAGIEIVEYVVTKTVPRNGVGGYDNNMQDLIANLAGGLCHAAIWKVRVIRERFS
jgi:uncharacterized membrane protein YjdF